MVQLYKVVADTLDLFTTYSAQAALDISDTNGILTYTDKDGVEQTFEGDSGGSTDLSGVGKEICIHRWKYPSKNSLGVLFR